MPDSPPSTLEMQKPARLTALTGLRCFAAINIVLFHFSNPLWFGWLAPIVNAGYASVSFFILLSGFVLAYNYAGRARQRKLDHVRFWQARFTRLYPIYLLSLLMAFQVVPLEYAAHSHGMFWTGMVLTPLLLQGWIPPVATFLNTPAWTMSSESFYYVLFPWMARWKRPERARTQLVKLAGVWMLGMIPGALYVIFHPDGIAHPDRWSYGPWLQALKYTPIPHLASFVFGVLLAGLDEIVGRTSRLRVVLGVFGFAVTFTVLTLAAHLPYAMLHDGILMPLFGCIILGLAGNNWLARAFSFQAAGLCRRGQLLPLPAPLQLLEPDSQHPCAGPDGTGPVRSVDQLSVAHRNGAAGSAPGGEAGAGAVAKVDERVEMRILAFVASPIPPPP